MSASVSLVSTGLCWNVSWSVRWSGSPGVGGVTPGSGGSTPNGTLWQFTSNCRMIVDPRRNGWRAFAFTCVVARPPGRSSISSRSIDRRRASAGSRVVTDRREAVLPWLANCSWYLPDHRPDAVVLSAHVCSPATPASSRRPSATAE